MSGEALADLSICVVAGVSTMQWSGAQIEKTDLSCTLSRVLFGSQRVPQTLRKLPQGLVLGLPRHVRVWSASQCGEGVK
jgi:hypothetical protein